MEKGHRIRHLVAAGVFALAAAPATLQAQSIFGRVIGAEDSRPVVGATVTVTRPGGESWSALSGDDGRFRILLPDDGRYLVGARSLGFQPTDSIPVEVEGSREQVEVVIRLGVEPIGIEGLTVVARGMDVRHLATLEGFRVRHEAALDVGSVRLFDRSDPEFRSSFDLQDMAQWIDLHRVRCLIWYVDGRSNPRWGDAPTIPLEGIEGIEFYLNGLDAPLELRGQRPPCHRTSSYSVIAIWRR